MAVQHRAAARYALTAILLVTSRLVEVGISQTIPNHQIRAANAESETLYLLVLAPYPDTSVTVTLQPHWSGGAGLVPAARLAVELINDRDDLLSDYSLALVERDSGCNELNMKGLFAFTQEFFLNQRKILGIIGPACSGVAVQTGRLSRPDKATMVQVTIANSPVLTDRENFPYTFLTISSARESVLLILKLIEENGWKRVGVLYEALNVFHQALHETFVDELRKDNESSVLGFSFAVHDTYLPLQQMKDSHLRIFVLMLSPQLARKLMCAAHHDNHNFAFPTYQWILMARRLAEFRDSSVSVSHNGRTHSCSGDELVDAIEGSILEDYNLVTTKPNEPTVLGRTYKEYEKLYARKVEEHERELNICIPISQSYANAYHDAVWAMALALNASIQPLTEYNLTLSDFQPGRRDIADIISQQFTTVVQFSGVSGEISFDNLTGCTHTPLKLFQVQDANETRINDYKTNSTLPNGTFIQDTFEARHTEISVATFTVFLSITILMLIATVTLHSIHILKSKYPSVKASSPALNHFMFLGCYLLVLALTELLTLGFLPSLDDTFGMVLCNSVLGFSHLGTTLILATICAKMWRIYRIFVHSWKPGNYMCTKVLAVTIFFLVLPVIIYCLIRSFVNPLKLTHTEELSDGNGSPYIEDTTMCEYKWYDSVVMHIYEGLFLFFALYLSVLTRHVNLKNFQSTRSISSLIYSLVFIAAVISVLYRIAVLTSWPLDGIYSIQYLEFNCVLLVSLLFGLLPPILPLIRNKVEVLRIQHSLSLVRPGKDVMFGIPTLQKDIYN